MAATWATARCPACRTPLATLVPAAPGVRWYPCAHCGAPVPVVPPTNPPPLFSWEVFPLVYPPLPPLRVPGRALGRLAGVALIACAVLLVGLAGALAYGGAAALGPTKFALSGTIESAAAPVPVPGALVVLTSETGGVHRTESGPQGTFTLTGIAAGGATLNVTASGYGSVALDLFFSPTYSATGAAGGAGLVVALPPGPGVNTTVAFESPFSTLEGFVASLWSAGALLALAGILAAAGAVAALRQRSAPVGVAAGLGAAAAPTALSLLGVTSVFPLTAAPAAVLVLLGMIAAMLELLPILGAGHAADAP